MQRGESLFKIQENFFHHKYSKFHIWPGKARSDSIYKMYTNVITHLSCKIQNKSFVDILDILSKFISYRLLTKR